MDEATSSPTPNPDHSSRGCRRGRRWLLAATFALAGALTAAVASGAIGQYAYGGGWRASFDPARIEDRADRMTRHVAIEIDATNDQQEKLRAIVKGAVKDLLPMREKSLSLRQRARALLTENAVDRAGIETLRSEQMGLADAASKRIAQALGDAAEVLTPEQRRKLGDRLDELRERRGFWHGWHHG
jgi:Spy/CpxP family protein refolding chaperone